jgi:hypothetical protein
LGILILEINIVDHQFGTTATLNDENHLLDTLEYNDFVSVLDHSQTKPMSVSSPRIISPKNENVLDKHTKDNIISSLHVLEYKMCEISKRVDSKYVSTNSYQNLEDIEKRQLILENRIDKIAQEKFATVDDLVNMSKLHAKENNDKFEQKIVALVNEKLINLEKQSTSKENEDLKIAVTKLREEILCLITNLSELKNTYKQSVKITKNLT